MSETDDVLREMRDAGIPRPPEAGDAGDHWVRQVLEEEMARGNRRFVRTRGSGRAWRVALQAGSRSRVPWITRSRRFALVGGIAVAGLAVAGVLALQGSGFTTSPAVAATMDRLAHIAANQGWGGVPGPGQYLYTKSESVQGSGGAVEDSQAWSSSGGGVLLSDPEVNRNDGQVVAIGGPGSYFPTTVSGWQSLSSDPATLLRQIHHLDGGPDTAAEHFTNVGDALRGTIPPASRAALYRAVALIPGVRLMGPQTDPTGQSGLGVGYYADGKLQSELIFDQQTARLIGELDYDQAGNVTFAASYIEQKIVASAPSEGSTPPPTKYSRFHPVTPQGQPKAVSPSAPTTTAQRTTTTP